MKQPPPQFIAAAVVATLIAAIVTIIYFISPYVLDLSDLQLNQSKVVMLERIPEKIIIVSDKPNAVYAVWIYSDGTFVVNGASSSCSTYNGIYYNLHRNGTSLKIKKIDGRHMITIVAKYVYNEA